VKLVKASAVILAFKITLHILKKLLDPLKSCIQGSHLVFRGKFLQQFNLSGISLRRLTLEILNDVVCGLVGKLKATAQVDKLSGNGVIQHSIAAGWVGVRILVLVLVHNWLLLLLCASLVGGNSLALAGSGLKHKLEYLEGIGVLGGGGRDTEGVSGRESNLSFLSKRRIYEFAGMVVIPY